MKPIQAVAAVPVCRSAGRSVVYMVKRQGHLATFPGYHSFPWDLIRQPQADDAPLAALDKIVEEQLGFHLEEARESGIVKGIHLLDSAPLDGFSPRWNTAFYLVETAEPAAFPVDHEKILEGEWSPPEALIERFDRAHLLVLPAVLNLLRILQNGLAPGEVTEPTVPCDPDKEIPRLEPIKGVVQLIPRSIAFPMAHRTNCFIIGDHGRPRVAVDPSAVNRPESRKLVKKLQELEVTHIFLTHHHMDHYSRLPRMARQLSLPVYMSSDTRQRIQKRKGAGYFRGVEILPAREGDLLTRWLDRPVRVYEVPGHDEGQLALAPDGMEWFLAGDLIQGNGTVVVTTREGDMTKYFQSLERIIGLNPAVIFPSHGLALGTVEPIKKILEHRRIREQQILHLYRKGTSPRQMVRIIYGKPKALTRWLALENIKSHLKKLEQEGII